MPFEQHDPQTDTAREPADDAPEPEVYSQDEAELVARRLAALGYIE